VLKSAQLVPLESLSPDSVSLLHLTDLSPIPITSQYLKRCCVVHTELRMFGMWQTLIIILVTFIIIIGAAVVTTMLTSSDSDNYLQERATILSREESTFYGHNVNLTAKEILVNKILLKEKTEELTVGYKNSSNFLPSVHFFQAKDRIDKSPVFTIIKKCLKQCRYIRTCWLEFPPIF
jgi:hypothetical protein